jgi:hypothetical protein
MHVMPPPLAGSRVHADPRGWRGPLPPPLRLRVGIIPPQTVRQIDPPEASCQVALVQLVNVLHLRGEWRAAFATEPVRGRLSALHRR